MSKIEFEQFKKYKCKIKLRPAYKGTSLKEAIKPFDGKALVFECLYMFDDDEKYANEWCLLSDELPSEVSWITSGDVEIICEV